jgi:NAD(P)-dependent dehydrogenase (short-subunit alcohol dehydrogenase family)
LIETPMDLFSQVMRTNVDAQVGLVSAVLPMMRANQYGRLVWISSGLGRFGLPRYGVYCASKHAVEGLMKTVAEEHRDAGVISVSVAPGMVQTEMLKEALLGGDTSAYQTPEETAKAFVRLCAALKPEDNGKGLDIAEWL